MASLHPDRLPAEVRELYRSLQEERILFDLRDAAALDLLRQDVSRVARDMDDDRRPPPMLWSGIPLPSRTGMLDCDWCLTISVGGTKTDFLMIRCDKGELVGLDAQGREVAGEELSQARGVCSMRTPTHNDIASGEGMIERIVDRISEYLERCGEPLQRSRHILLSWGFPNRVVRTAEHVLGGLTARVSRMTKDQSGFTDDLMLRDIGDAFSAGFSRRLGWTRPVTVANDGVMALHYFLDRADGYGQIGLFINGTGANFCLAEPCAVRPEGVVSRAGETYEPRRIVPPGELAPGEKAVPFLINYEAGSIELGATRTRIDLSSEYPIERNALAGGNAFEQQFRELVRFALGHETYDRLLRAAPQGSLESAALAGPEVSRISISSEVEVDSFFPGTGLDAASGARIRFLARAVLARSALHAALILAAVTRRTGFGLGDEKASKADLLGIEGSVWRSEGYREQVREYWRELVGSELRVEFQAEKNFAASARGPLWLTFLHEAARGEDRQR